MLPVYKSTWATTMLFSAEMRWRLRAVLEAVSHLDRDFELRLGTGKGVGIQAMIQIGRRTGIKYWKNATYVKI
jgi:hypothetical protein